MRARGLATRLYSPSEAQGLSHRAPALFDSIHRDAVVVAGLGPQEWVTLDASA